MNPIQSRELDQILEGQLQVLAATLKPATIAYYRAQAHRFLRYLHLHHPELSALDQLRRNPHVLGWLRSLAEENPPLTSRSRRAALFCIRRLFDDLADNGYPVRETLILRQDFPPRDLCLPKPVTPDVDRLLDRELRRTNDLLSNALLLLRATGMRVGECLRLNRDSLRHLGGSQWSLHVPLGKLHSERWVPLDDSAHQIFNRILSLTAPLPSEAPNPSAPLLRLPQGGKVTYGRICKALKDASRRAGCPPVRLHQLRHTFATDMLRSGLSLPALKEILGHRDIRMTMGYVQVTQQDLQREYHLARQRMATLHSLPQLSTTHPAQISQINMVNICHALDSVRHLLEMYRRQLNQSSSQRKLHCLDRRLAKLRRALTDFQKE